MKNLGGCEMLFLLKIVEINSKFNCFFCVQDVIYPDWSHVDGFTLCLLVFAILFWIFRAARVFYQIYQFGEIRTFYHSALGKIH